MANNKYSEELFGAIDTIIEKRLQSLNKDTTILCVIEENTDAEEGKYIVSNSGLRFDAYSDKTTYSIGQRVWVLVPDGDYENTKMIMGQYISENSANFTWVNPLASFVDMTGNLCDESITKQEFALVANHPTEREIFYLDGDSIVSEGTDLSGLSRIGVTVDFRTAFNDKIYAGSYGLILTIITDKVESVRNGINQYHKEDFEFSTTSKPSGISGSVFDFKQTWTQFVAFNFDPEEIGNVTAIICRFFQRPGSFLYHKDGNVVEFPYKDDDGVVVDPNIFISNLDIRMGYSTDQVKGTTVFFKPAKGNSLEYSSAQGAEQNTRYINFRVAYDLGNGTYKFINNYSSLVEFQNQNNGYPKLYLYRQDLSKEYTDNRAGFGWYQQDWTQQEGFINDDTDDEEFSGDNLWVKVILKKSGREKYKMALAFKNETPNANSIETEFYRIHEESEEGLFPNFHGFTDDEKCAIELFLRWPYSDKEVYGDLRQDSSRPVDDECYIGEDGQRHKSFMKLLKDGIASDQDGKYDDLKLDDGLSGTGDTVTWKKLGKPDILRNYLILYKEFELYGEIRDKCDFLLTPEEEEAKGITPFLDFLIQTTIYNKYGTSEDDPIKNFNLAKSEIETIYLSDPVTFTDKVSDGDEVAALLYGLRLVATDDKNGIYNIYKAGENANSELIKANDTYVKRSIEASFNAVVTQDESLDKAERVYWLIPRYSTMIKSPTNGTNYGTASYNLTLYTREEFSNWWNDRANPETGTWPVSPSGQSLQDGKNLYYLDGSEYKEVTVDMHYEDLPGSSSSAARLYTKTAEKLLISISDPVPEGDDSIQIYNDDFRSSLSDSEKTFLDGTIDSYYIILEDKQEEANKTLSGKLKKASVTYQIKSTYRKSLNNNKIYVAVSRNDKLYTASLELIFGVKGTNGTDYTLSILPLQENLKADSETGRVNISPNVWTFLGESSNADTESFILQATVYDVNDKPITQDIVYNFDLLQGSDSFELHPNGNVVTITRKNNGLTGNKYKGAIISCTATNDAFNIKITQYYILPVRTDIDFAYIDGPETVIYDTINSNPSYYNTQYSLKRTNDVDIKITNVIPREANVADIQDEINRGGDAQYFPTIKQSGTGNDKVFYLVPKATYVEGINYDFYIEITAGGHSWYQPIMIGVNKYANTSVKAISANLIVTNDDDKGTSTIMSVLKKDNGKLTGTIIGNLPQVGTGDEAISRAGLLGYNQDREVYGFLDDGSGFIGTETAQAKFNGDEWGLFTKAINNYEAQLMKLAEDEKYLRSLNYVTSNGAQGLSINLQTGEIIGSLSASNIPTHNHSIADIYWNNNGNNNRVSANTVFAGPTSGQNAVPSFRQLTATDINGFNSSVTTALSNTAIGSIKIGNYTYSISVKSNEDGSLFPYSPETYSIVLTRN